MIGRGQTLVLFALTMLLLALLAFITLGLGVRIKERMELQTAADAAAYSNAVAIARTFNSLAIVNRTEWSLLVAQSAAQSYISWATAYRGAVEGLGDALIAGGPGCAAVRVALNDERARVVQEFEAGEIAAFRELRELADVQERLLEEDAREDYLRLEEMLDDEEITQKIIRGANDDFAWQARSLPVKYGHDKTLSRDCWTGVACDLKKRSFMLNRPGFRGRENWMDNQPNWLIVRHQHEIVMGTRGDPFTTDRIGGQAIANRLRAALGPGVGVQWRADTGSSYRQTSGGGRLGAPSHSSDFMIDDEDNARYPVMHPGGAMSDDHGWLSVRSLTCRVSDLEIEAVVRNGARVENNAHVWGAGGVYRECPLAHDRSHALPNLGYGHSWPLIIDFNDSQPTPEGDLQHSYDPYVPGWGRFINQQPTFWVALEREPRRDDPWDLRFTFGGQRHEVGPTRRSRLAPYNELFTYPDRVQRPVALSRGLAYYHRGDDWREPANFVNPFWQATLISTRWERP